MADQNRLEIIRNNPIGRGLEAFLASFGSLCESKEIPCSREAVDQLDDEDLQNIAIELLSALQGLRVSRLLPSRNGKKNLLRDLPGLISAVDSDAFDFDRVKPLLRAVIDRKPDEEIWNQVYYALTESTPPPRTIASRLHQTPSSRNLGSLVNSSERRNDTDPVVKEDLGPMYVDIPQFYETFFGGITELKSASRPIFEKCCEGSEPFFREGWTGWPRDAQEPAVLSWLQKIVEQLTQWAQDYRQTPARGLLAEPNKPLGGSTAKRKLDVGIVTHPEALAHWSQILIPGELKSNPDEDQKDGAWFDIGRYVREVFAAQDTRRFVLAFTLCGPLMRIWEFDRLGGIASTRFDINKDGVRFVSIILAFLWIEERELGFDPTIITANNKQYVEIIRGGIRERIVIDGFMGRVRCITGRATTCWKAHPEGSPSVTLVIKDSWQYPEREEEGELLLKVTRKGVSNVARYYHHETVRLPNGNVDDIQRGIRKGLDITKASNYRSQQLNLPRDLGTLSISQDSATGQKRSSSQTGAPLPPGKRSRSESPIKIDPSTLPSRIHRRVIIRDYGQPIYKASSPVALLGALEGCIDGHESLLKAGILHRDISANNLMINEDNNNPSWSSFLIDLDLAIPIDRRNASGARGKTGTRAFMAIGALLGEQHSFMHDLESFFWVLFWICIHYNGPDEDIGRTEFETWNFLGTKPLAIQKLGHVAQEIIFTKVITESFTPYYKPLVPWVNRLRMVIFDNNGQGEGEALYSRMRDVLREAREGLTHT
ncbi:hypothetical protein F5Y06DRAFT_274145 [Hypoxylon sp. FL0890]|nr:hypothetical protein F5Y06DRAFT_274145 [Hypoxylon sp. FL0890]